jgi:hypothetical protein
MAIPLVFISLLFLLFGHIVN